MAVACARPALLATTHHAPCFLRSWAGAAEKASICTSSDVARPKMPGIMVGMDQKDSYAPRPTAKSVATSLLILDVLLFLVHLRWEMRRRASAACSP